MGAIDADKLFDRGRKPDREDELYFSFVTLSTVGYGDLTPAGASPRSFAVAEMLFGQIYLVTVVSLIVSNLTAARRRARAAGRASAEAACCARSTASTTRLGLLTPRR